MKYAVYFVLILLFTFSEEISFAQTAPAIEWQKCLGGSDFDNISSIIQTADGGFAIAGTTGSNDGDAIGNHGAYDAWVVKLTAAGDIDWQKCLGGTSYDYGKSIIETTEGDFIIAGNTHSNDGDVYGNHGDVDAWVVKLDRFGNLLWQKCFGGTGSDGVTAIIETPNVEGGGYIFAGGTTSKDGDITGKHSGEQDSALDAWVVKITKNGNIEWQKCLGGSDRDNAFTIIHSPKGGYVISGTTYSQDGDFKDAHKDSIGTKNNDAWVVKLNASGNIEWEKCFGGSDNDGVNSIVRSPDGGYIIAGQTNSVDGEVIGLHPNLKAPFFPRNNDAWIVKIDSIGGLLWQKCLGGANSDVALSIIQDSDTKFVFAGLTNSNDGDVTDYHGAQENFQFWIASLTSTGNIIWQKCLGGSKGENQTCLAGTTDRGYILGGYTFSNDGDVSGNHGILPTHNDGWIVKLKGTLNTVENRTSDIIQSKFFWIYPNPSSTELHLRLLESLSLLDIKFYDILGAPLFPEYRLQATEAVVDIHSFPSGIYLARLSYVRKGISGSFTIPLIVQQ